MSLKKPSSKIGAHTKTSKPTKGCKGDCGGDCGKAKADPTLVADAVANATQHTTPAAYTTAAQQAAVGKIAASMPNDTAATKSTGTHVPIPLTWSFKGDVAKKFDSHVHAQLPFYGMVSEMVAFMANQFLPQGNGRMYDIGCSTGNITSRIRNQLEAKKTFVTNIDSESDILEQFHGYGEILWGAAQTVSYEPFNVATMMLTMGFIPVDERVSLLRRLYSQLLPGGAIIMVEKFQPRTVQAQELFRRANLYFKTQNGENPKDILAKEFSLGGILRPVSIELFSAAEIPSNRIESFFQLGEFAGWIIFGEPV